MRVILSVHLIFSCSNVMFALIKIMKAYKQFITTVGKLLGGDDQMEKRAEEIVAFEKKLAKVRLLATQFSLHDYSKFMNILDRSSILSDQKSLPLSILSHLCLSVCVFIQCVLQISVPDADKTDTWFNRMTIGKLKKEAPGVRKR